MSNVPQHLIDEATRRGIVPGAFIACAYGTGEGVVDAYDKWTDYRSSIWCGVDNTNNSLRAYSDGKWATVINPAPAAEGLKEGDAVECGPAMRAAIIELANELGLLTEFGGSSNQRFIRWMNHRDGKKFIVDSTHADGTTMHTLEAFIAKMRVTASQPKPIKVNGHEVKWEKGVIKVGCQTITNDTVRAIAAKLIDP